MTSKFRRKCAFDMVLAKLHRCNQLCLSFDILDIKLAFCFMLLTIVWCKFPFMGLVLEEVAGWQENACN